MAVLLRRAYSLAEWLPPETLLHLRRVDVHAEMGTVFITLDRGTRILDMGGRITVRGTADDVAISEMVACAARRGLLLPGMDAVECPLGAAKKAAL